MHQQMLFGSSTLGSTDTDSNQNLFCKIVNVPPCFACKKSTHGIKIGCERARNL